MKAFLAFLAGLPELIKAFKELVGLAKDVIKLFKKTEGQKLIETRKAFQSAKDAKNQEERVEAARKIQDLISRT